MTGRTALVLAASTWLGVSACYRSHERDPRDAGLDAARAPDAYALADAGHDVGVDAGRDAGSDTGPDMGPPPDAWVPIFCPRASECPAPVDVRTFRIQRAIRYWGADPEPPECVAFDVPPAGTLDCASSPRVVRILRCAGRQTVERVTVTSVGTSDDDVAAYYRRNHQFCTCGGPWAMTPSPVLGEEMRVTIGPYQDDAHDLVFTGRDVGYHVVICSLE
jgi:hypothetical protein